MTSLERELMRMELAERAARTAARGYGINIRAYRQFFPAKAAAQETPKMGNGIKLNGDGTVTVNGTRYTRDEFRGALEMNIKAQREDLKSAYRNARDPNHKQAVEEINLAYRWLGGELTESDEREIVAESHDATQESSEVTTTTPSGNRGDCPQPRRQDCFAARADGPTARRTPESHSGATR